MALCTDISSKDNRGTFVEDGECEYSVEGETVLK